MRRITAALAALTLGTGAVIGAGSASAMTDAEQRFLNKARTLPTAAWPQGRFTQDADMVAGGYRACQTMDRHQNTQDAEKTFYANHKPSYEQKVFLIYATQDLCPRHAHRYENF